jgi:NAD(P)-dependent dehydrogenase (short-subunit alcohol dehydrogenase family)
MHHPTGSKQSFSPRDGSLLQRMIEPEEIANLVAFVASPLSSATNGAALRVDGGVIPTIG